MATSIIEGRKLLETVTLNSNVSSGAIKIYAVGNGLYLLDVEEIVLASDLAAGNEIVVGTITNTALRRNAMGVILNVSSGKVRTPACIRIDSGNGQVLVMNSASVGSKIYGYGKVFY